MTKETEKHTRHENTQSSGTSLNILKHASEMLLLWDKKRMPLDTCIDMIRQDSSIGKEKAVIASILFEYFRHKSFVDNLISQRIDVKKTSAELQSVLCCVLSQIFFQSGIPMQSAVNVAVEHAKMFGKKSAGSFVNAVLRAIIRETADFDNIPCSFPDTLKQRWDRQFGEEKTADIIHQYASNPSVSFRLRRDLSGEQLSLLSAKQIEISDFTSCVPYYETDNASRLFSEMKNFSDAIYIQDPAASLFLSILDHIIPNGKFLDACAAPGGKTILMFDCFGLGASSVLDLTAADKSEKRIRSMKENFERLHIHADLHCLDVCKIPQTFGFFDWILADVPCSNTGVIRRRPDVPWRFSLQSLREIADLQKNILDSLAVHVKSNGYLIYSTCSIEPEENFGQVEKFLLRHPEFTLRKQMQLFPGKNHDGAFAALLFKR